MPLALFILNGELGGETIPLAEGHAITIGRDEANTIRLGDRKLSRIHCQIEVIGGRCQVTDLNSTNGTLVNGERVYADTWVSLEEEIEVGQTQIRLVEISEDEAVAASAAEPESGPSSEIRCEECGKPITQEELDSGKGRHVGDRYYCPGCCASFDSDADGAGPNGTAAEGAAESASERFEPGKEIAGVRIISFVGEGRLGPLYEGEQISMGRLVALKVLNVTDEDWAKKYLKAVYASGKLVHPNIALIFDAGEIDGMYYMIREYVQGQSAAERLAGREPVPLAEVFPIITQVAYALEHACERRTFHGTLSPRKILLGRNEMVKVTGFGLPQTLASGQSIIRNSWHVLPYAAPERLRDESALDFASDVYSLVAVFYHLLTGQPPFSGSTREKVERRILKASPKPLSEFTPNLPEAAQKIVIRGLSKDPRARYQLPRELLYDLEENLRKQL